MINDILLDNIEFGIMCINQAEEREPIDKIIPEEGGKEFRLVVEMYGSALQSFSEVLDRYPMQIAAVQGFGYCMAKLKYYYSECGLGGINVLLSSKYGHYLGKEHAPILKEYGKLQEFIKKNNMKLFP